MSSSNNAIGHHAAKYYEKELNDGEESSSCLFAFQLAHGMALPMALKAAIELNILELMKEAGPGSFVSPAELAARTASTNPEASTMIDRILRLLAGCRILNCKFFDGDGYGTVERRYSLGPVCRFLTKNEDGVSMAPLFLMCNDKVHLESWYHLKEAVIEGGVPFEKAHGMSPFEHTRKDPKLNKMFNLGMSNVSTIIVKKILDVYDGFEGLDSMVDVGGGMGAIIEAIVSKYPTIRGVNFDLPHVIRDAPQHSRVENIGGDMFVSVPEADAIFVKNILHDWSDEHCVKILKNCRKALTSSDDGKVIVAERILSETPETGLEAVDLYADVIMMAYTRGGRERTEKEFHALAEQAGFTKFRKVCLAYYIWIMEFIK